MMTDPNPMPGDDDLPPPVPKTFRYDEKRLLDESISMITRRFGRSRIVSPQNLSKNHPICASSLTISESDDDNSNFRKFKIQERLDGKELEALEDDLDTFLKKSEKEIMDKKVRLFSELVQLEARIMTTMQNLAFQIRTEADLRYGIGDPILDFLCSSWKLNAELEETVERSTSASDVDHVDVGSTPQQYYTHSGGNLLSATPGTLAAKSVTPKSHADYTCYTVRDRQKKLIVLIIETKLEGNSNFAHAVAQVIGYGIAFETGETSPPILIVLSERKMDILFFPFSKYEVGKAKPTGLVDCVLLENLPLWESGKTASIDLRSMVAVLLFTSRAASFGVHTIQRGICTRAVLQVQTQAQKTEAITEQRIAMAVAELQQRVAELKKELEQRQKEITKMLEERRNK